MTAALSGAAALLLAAVLFASVLAPLWRERRGAAWLLGIALPALAAPLYLTLGEPRALQVETAAAAEAPGIGPAQVLAMVERLAARLEREPDDAAGWRRLARSYETLQRHADAVAAYARLRRLTPDDPDMLVDYAVTLAISRGAGLRGEPEALIEAALRARPGHLQALALAGSVALEKNDRAGAARLWRQVLAAVPADSALARSVAGSIAKVESGAWR